jgi:hypothetical protein
MNNLMSDINSGFVHRRLPDGGFKQQYSPMVMRKFKKSLDNGGNANEVDSPDSPLGLNSPRLTRRNRGGSFSGPSLQDLNGDAAAGGTGVNSPSLNRRRRSRIPSEEDDQLINFLVTGGHDGSRERNVSVGNLVADSQQNYGSLDRSLMRRSRGRRRPDMLNIDQDRDRSAPTQQPPQPVIVEKPVQEQPPEASSGKFKNRIHSWLKDAEEDAEKADMYLNKKREIKQGDNTTNNKKSTSKTSIVADTDVLKAMEAVEDASGQREKSNPRKKTPPSQGEERKRLIRELGRKPSEEKVSLYVRKPSKEEEAAEAAAAETKAAEDTSRTKKFIDSMARRSMEVPTDFLNTIEEERTKTPENKPTPGKELAKKYPFNRFVISALFYSQQFSAKSRNLFKNSNYYYYRTTTPNSLREHLMETLTKNLGGSASDIADTIEHFKNDEMRDTFDVDNENIDSPPVQRKAFRQQRSLRLPNPSSPSEPSNEDNQSEAGSDFGGRRRNLKFRTLGGDGTKPLGDREMLLKKKRASTSDLAFDDNGREVVNGEDDMGNGLFDRFSAARKTLTRSSVRRKRDEEDTKSLNEAALSSTPEKKTSITSDWKSKLASKFKKSSVDHYDLLEDNGGQPSLSSYRKTSDEFNTNAPEGSMTEPTRRRTLNPSSRPNPAVEQNNRSSSRDNRAKSVLNESESSSSRLSSSRRKTSYAGDYDSELVDGKYVTSVPIINPEDGNDPDDGNLRPANRVPPRGLKDLKANSSTNARDTLIDRLSRSTSVRENGGERKAVSTSNVFNRLATDRPKTNLNGSRRSLAVIGPSSTSSPTRSTTRNEPGLTNGDHKRGNNALSKIRDLTKTLRKNSKEEDSEDNVAPRNSFTLFNDRNKHMSNNLNDSKSSINSSTRSLQKDSPKTTRRATASTLGNYNARFLIILAIAACSALLRVFRDLKKLIQKSSDRSVGILGFWGKSRAQYSRGL